VFGRADLLALADLVERHGLTVISDEIWADLVLDPATGHVPFASLDHAAARRAITLVAPSKTWNLAGLGCAAAIVPDAAHRRPVAGGRRRACADGQSTGLCRCGGSLADMAIDGGNNSSACSASMTRSPPAAVAAGFQGSRWCPRRPRIWHGSTAAARAWPTRRQPVKQPALGRSDGRDFGFPGFIRLNLACPTARLEEALRRLARA